MRSPVFYSPDIKNVYKMKSDINLHYTGQQIYIWNRQYENEKLARKRHEELLDTLIKLEKRLSDSANQNFCIQNTLLNRINTIGEQNKKINQLTNSELEQLASRIGSLESVINKAVSENLTRAKEQQAVQNQMLQMLRSENDELNKIHAVLNGLVDEYRWTISDFNNQLNTLGGEIKDNIHEVKEEMLSTNEKHKDEISELLNSMQKELRGKDDIINKLNTIQEDLGKQAEIIDLLNMIQHNLQSQENQLVKLQASDDEKFHELKTILTELKDLLKEKNPYQYFKIGNRISIIDRNGNKYSGVFIKDTDHEIIWVDDATNRLSITNKRGITISKET